MEFSYIATLAFRQPMYQCWHIMISSLPLLGTICINDLFVLYTSHHVEFGIVFCFMLTKLFGQPFRILKHICMLCLYHAIVVATALCSLHNCSS